MIEGYKIILFVSSRESKVICIAVTVNVV